VTKTATLESEPNSQKAKLSYIKWFREIGIEDVAIVGGKTAFEENFRHNHRQHHEIRTQPGLEN